MGNFTRIGVIVGLFLLLGVNLNNISGLSQINGIDSKDSGNSDILSLTNQESYEFLPDNSTWTDYPIDDDRNGYYDHLVINLGPPKLTDQDLGVYGILNDSEGNLLGICQLYPWQIGNELLLSFQGQPINANGANGSYHVWVGTFQTGWWYYTEDYQMLLSFVTTDYNASDFESPNAKITEISDYGNDTDTDGAFEEIIFDLTVEVKDRGYYDLEMYLGPSAPFPDSNRDFVRSWGGFLTPEDTTIIVIFPIQDHPFYQIQGPLNVSYITFKLYGIDIQFLTDNHKTNSYSLASPLTYANLTGNYRDWGVDTDFDGKFNELVIQVEVNISLAGIYRIEMYLTTPDYDQGGWNQWEYHDDHLNEGVHNVTLSFDTRMVYSLRYDTSFIVESVRIRDEDYEMMDSASSPFTTRVYNSTEFDIPAAFVGNFWDKGVDTNSDGRFDILVIEAEINFILPGTYLIELFLKPFGTDKDDWNQWTDLRQDWSEGVTNVSFSFDARSFYSLRNDTSFKLEYLQIRGENYEMMDYASSPYTTRVYNYTEFDFPDASLTGNFRGQAVVREGDNKFKELEFDIEINVTEASNYRIEIQIKSVAGNFHFWEEHNEYLNEGLHWISSRIDGTDIFQNRANTPFILTQCRIIHTDDDWFTVDLGYSNYTTRSFNYTEFTPPNAYLTGNYWDRGVDTDLNGRFDEIIIDVEVNVTQEGNYWIDLNLRPCIPVWDSYFWGSSFSNEYDLGIHNFSVQLYVTLPYSLRLDTTYVIESITVYSDEDYWGEIDRVDRPYITHQYRFSDFDFPEVVMTGNYWDYGVDTDADGKYNSLTIDIEINVTQSGSYYFECNIHSQYWEYSNWESFYRTFQEGIHNISFSIDTWFITPLLSSTYFVIDNFRILKRMIDYNQYLLDRLVSSLQTQPYSSNAFDPPSIFLTNIFFDYGENTDNDNEFEELHFYIGINVTENDTYRIELGVEMSVWDETGDYGDYFSFDTSLTQYLEERINIYIIFPIDVGEILEYNIWNFPQYDFLRVELRSINIFDSINNLCFSADWIYRSSEYEIDNFEFSLGSVTGTWTLTSTTERFPYLDNSPTWNVPFGIAVLSTISILLYLLQRTRQH